MITYPSRAGGLVRCVPPVSAKSHLVACLSPRHSRIRLLAQRWRWLLKTRYGLEIRIAISTDEQGLCDLLHGAGQEMRTIGTCLQAIKIGADVVSGQVQHLAPKPPALLDLPLGFRRPSGKFPCAL